MRLSVSVIAISLFGLPGMSASAAPTSWIDHYIAAHGNCGQPFGILTTVPMGKPIADWTLEDLKLLKQSLDRCEALMNMPLRWTSDVYNSVESLVREQQARVTQQREALAYKRDQLEQQTESFERKAAEEKEASLERFAALRRRAEEEDAEKKAAEQRIVALTAERAAADELAAKAEARQQVQLEEERLQRDIESAKQRRIRAEADSVKMTAAAQLHGSTTHKPASTPPSHFQLEDSGMAKICLTDDNVLLQQDDLLTIPATTVFQDEGPNTGTAGDPSTWSYGVKEGPTPSAAFVTLAPVNLKVGARCADAKVEMLTGPLWTAASQRAAEAHIFTMRDVIDYPIPEHRPAVETGKLIDDLSITAIVLKDVTSARALQQRAPDASGQQCLEGARKLAAFVGGGLGKQTSMIVPIGGILDSEVAYGCAMGASGKPDLFVSWNGHAKPPASTVGLIKKAGEYLTGATQTEMQEATSTCVNEALKPDTGEAGSIEIRGVKVECQAFARDGGGGSVTIYRRFGDAPAREQPTSSALSGVDRASASIKASNDKIAEDTMRFAKWYRDPSIPEKVKAFVMLAARVVSLDERCPTARSHDEKLGEWARNAAVEPADLQPGGKYADLLAHMLTAVRADAARESIDEACEASRKYD